MFAFPTNDVNTLNPNGSKTASEYLFYAPMTCRTQCKGKAVSMGGLQTLTLSYMRHSGEEGADVAHGPVEFQRTLFDVFIEDFVTVEHGDVPDAAQG